MPDTHRIANRVGIQSLLSSPSLLSILPSSFILHIILYFCLFTLTSACKGTCCPALAIFLTLFIRLRIDQPTPLKPLSPLTPHRTPPKIPIAQTHVQALTSDLTRIPAHLMPLHLLLLQTLTLHLPFTTRFIFAMKEEKDRHCKEA